MARKTAIYSESLSTEGVLTRYFRVNMQYLVYIKAILESYEGMALVRTDNREACIIEVWINPHFENEIDQVLDALSQEVQMQAINDPSSKATNL